MTQTLMNTRCCRELKAMWTLTFVLPAKEGVVAAMKGAGAAYAAKVKEMGKDHSLGPPVCSVAHAMLSFLSTADVGAANKTALGQILAAMETAPVAEMYAAIPICRLEKAYEQDKLKLIVAAKEINHQNLIRNSMEQLGHKCKVGQPPPGYLEEELEAFLDALK